VDGIMASKLFATRQGTIVLGVIAAVIAAIALIVYLNAYRNSVNNTALAPVLVTKGLIEKGTSGSVILTGKMYTISHVAKSSVDAGALVDPSTLKGQVAVADIYPGTQLTAADFGPTTNSIAEQLSPNERAVAVPLGTPEQVGGVVTAGSHVDVWTYISDTKCAYELVHNAYVLSTGSGNATLRATPAQAGLILWGSNIGQEWLTLAATVATTPTERPICGPGVH